MKQLLSGKLLSFFLVVKTWNCSTGSGIAQSLAIPTDTHIVLLKVLEKRAVSHPIKMVYICVYYISYGLQNHHS